MFNNNYESPWFENTNSIPLKKLKFLVEIKKEKTKKKS